jgi:hypothetical protein
MHAFRGCGQRRNRTVALLIRRREEEAFTRYLTGLSYRRSTRVVCELPFQKFQPINLILAKPHITFQSYYRGRHTFEKLRSSQLLHAIFALIRNISSRHAQDPESIRGS